MLGNPVPVLCLLTAAIPRKYISQSLRKPLLHLKASSSSIFFEELHIRYYRGPISASEKCVIFSKKKPCKKLHYVQFYSDFTLIFFIFKHWEFDGIISSRGSEFSAIPHIVLLNLFKKIFTQRILEGYMQQEMEKMRQKHLQ